MDFTYRVVLTNGPAKVLSQMDWQLANRISNVLNSLAELAALTGRQMAQLSFEAGVMGPMHFTLDDIHVVYDVDNQAQTLTVRLVETTKGAKAGEAA